MKHKHLSSGIQKKYLKSTFILLFFALLLSMIGVWSYMHHTLKNNIIEKYNCQDFLPFSSSSFFNAYFFPFF